MKASKVASVVAALLATDAKPSEAAILAAIIAADKAKDAFPEKKEDKGEDEFPDKAKDAKEDDKGEDEFPDKAKDAKEDDKGEDEEVDGMDDEQPSVSASPGPTGKKPEPAKDKKGMDTAAVVKRALDARDALHAARRDVENVIGVVGYDSAAAVYKAACDKMGVALDGVDASAYATIFRLARANVEASAPTMASDAAAVSGMAGAIKGYSRLK